MPVSWEQARKSGRDMQVRVHSVASGYLRVLPEHIVKGVPSTTLLLGPMFLPTATCLAQ